MNYALYILASLLVLLSQSGCGRAQSSQVRGKRIIVLGIDGMDPKFLEAHWSSLPNLERLRQRGEFRTLATTIPPQSPVAWSSFITGMDPGGHGIYDFIHRNPETALPYSSMAETTEPERKLTVGPYVIPLSKGRVRSMRKGRAFWQILADHGVPVTILRMPMNFPPVECEGQSLSGMGTPDMRGTFSTFSFFTDQPGEKQRQVPGGQIIPVSLAAGRATLQIEGPSNTLHKDRPRSFVGLTVDVDPTASVARFQAGNSRFILAEGEWSDWIKVDFPLIPGVGAAGMFRVYAKKLKPDFRLYVSPVNIDPSRPELPISGPESYSTELARELGPFYTQGMAEDTAALRQGVLSRQEYLAQSRLVAQEHLALFRHALTRFREGLLFFHFFGVDQNSHMLWGKHDSELLETYKLVDEAVGWTVRNSGDATIIVMSDHGFTTFDRAVHLNTWLMQEGLLVLDDPANAGNDELFAHVDWSQTKAYSIGLNGLYLNLEGRERNGIVDPGESQAVLQTIKQRLLDFKDPKTGLKVVESVYFPSQQFHGAALDAAPDMIVGYSAGYRSSWQTALGSVPKVLIEENTEAWIGDHCIAAHLVPGVLISNRTGSIADPHLQDLPVTLLNEFGISKDGQMVGRPIYRY